MTTCENTPKTDWVLCMFYWNIKLTSQRPCQVTKCKTEKALVTNINLVPRASHLHPGNFKAEQAWASLWALHVYGLHSVKSSRLVLCYWTLFSFLLYFYKSWLYLVQICWFHFKLGWWKKNKSWVCLTAVVAVLLWQSFMLSCYCYDSSMLEYLYYQLFFLAIC